MSEDTSQRALRLVVEISATPADPDRWMTFLRLLADELGGAAIGLTLEIPNIGESRLVYRHNLDPTYNPVTARVIARRESPWLMEGMTDGFAHTSASDPSRSVGETPYYKECLIPQGVAPELPIAHVFARADDHDVAAIIIYRMEGGRRFTAEDLNLLSLLPPHLANAYSAYDALRSLSVRHTALSAVVDRFPTGVVLLDRAGSITEMNRNTERILAAKDGLTERSGRILATEESSNRELQRRIQYAMGQVNATIDVDDNPVAIERPSGCQPYGVVVSNVLRGKDWRDSRDVAATLFISDPENRNLLIRGRLTARYDLTEAESDLTALMCEGNSLEAAAARRNVSVNTARTQLKSVFRKTGAKRQGNLVALVLAESAGLEERRND